MSRRNAAGTSAALLVMLSLAACHSGAKPSSAAATPKAAAAPKGAPKAAPAPKTPPEVTPTNIALGDSLFNNGSCQRCHGKMGTGGKNGPDLTVGPFQHSTGGYPEILNTIMTGVPKTELKDATRPYAMNPRGGGRVPLTDDQVKAVAAYVYSISRNKK